MSLQKLHFLLNTQKLHQMSPWHSKWHILHLSIRVKINMIIHGTWPLFTKAKCVILKVTDSNPNIESSHPKFKQKINSKLNNSTENFSLKLEYFYISISVSNFFPKSSEIQIKRKRIAHLLTSNWKSRQENNGGNIKFFLSPKMVNNGESEKE